jgi:hypothetical protein
MASSRPADAMAGQSLPAALPRIFGHFRYRINRWRFFHLLRNLC